MKVIFSLITVCFLMTTHSYAAKSIIGTIISKEKHPGIPTTPKIPTNPNIPIKIPGKPGDGRITNIGNGLGLGGGLAEMRLIYLHQNLDRFLQICLTKDDVCHLSPQTKIEWQNLTVNQVRDSSQYVISFLPKIENEKGYILEGDQLKVSSQMLYIDLETPKRFGELLAFIVAVRQDIAGSVNSFATNLKIATDIFAKLKVEESLYRATGIPALLRIAQLKVNDGVQSHFLFTLEDSAKTVDLTQKLADSLPCGDLKDWNFSQWNSSISESAYIYGIASGTCDKVSVQKRILIQTNLSKDYLFDPESVTIRFFVN